MSKYFSGYSSYVILLPDNELKLLESEVNKYQDFMDIVEKYDKEGYWFVQVDVMDYQRTPQELTKFVLNHLPFLAIKEESSTYILARDKEEYKTALNAIYFKDEKRLVLCDMLSIGDRYDALVNKLQIDPMYADEIRIIYDRYGTEYSLIFERESKYLFSEETLITILDEMTMMRIELDMEECIGIFKFHVAILK